MKITTELVESFAWRLDLRQPVFAQPVRISSPSAQMKETKVKTAHSKQQLRVKLIRVQRERSLIPNQLRAQIKVGLWKKEELF